jgi:hypothetical protein
MEREKGIGNFLWVILLISFCIAPCNLVFSDEVYPHFNKILPASKPGRFYTGFLFGESFLLLPELITKFDLNDDLTFLLELDLYVGHPFVGTYEQVNKVAIQASGTTGRYYDDVFEEDVSIDCTFTAYLLGFRGLLMVGNGLRTFTFFDGDKPISDVFYLIAFDFVDL